MAVLLEELPLEDLRPLKPILGQVGRPLGEVERDRVGFSERSPVVDHQRRDPERGVECAEQFEAPRAIDHVDLAPLVLDPEMGEQLATL